MTRAVIISVLLLLGLADAARSDERCVNQLNRLVDQWKSIAVPGAPDARTSGSQAGHEHIAREVEYMRGQVRSALRLCNEGKEHEAMLRMDVVRAWLKLPEVQHPRDHRYRYNP